MPPRRSSTLAALAGCALLLGGCGGGSSTVAAEAQGAALVVPGLEPPAGCYLTVFLNEDVTRGEIRTVQRRLLANRAVTQVSYVPKSLELRRFALRNPKAAKGMHVNPFADRFEVVPRTNGSVFTIVADFATRGGPITNVKPAKTCVTGAAG